MNNLFRLIFLSSSDPAKVSFFIKGLSTFLIPILMGLFGWDHTTSGEFISDAVTLIATCITVIGLVRKIVLTYFGENKALK